MSSLQCEVWSVKWEVLRVESVKRGDYAAWSGECGVLSAQCGVLSVGGEVWSGDCELWSAKLYWELCKLCIAK